MAVKHVAGFTLIESIITICLMSFLVIGFSSLLAPQAIQTADTLTQQRASQLADMLLHEMYSRPFQDPNPLTSEDPTELGSDESDIARDDFDDYLTQGRVPISDFGIGLTGPYVGFEVEVNIVYTDDNWAVSSTPENTKRVTLAISRNSGMQPIEFHAFRSRY